MNRDEGNEFTDANELTTWGSGEPEYNAVGNMVDDFSGDDEHYEYVYDAFGRLREVKVRTTSLTVAKYVYNGLNHRISWSEKDPDSQSVPPDHIWFHIAYDAQWRQVAVYKEDDADPTERFVSHAAGLDGQGAASYIDSVILRDRDTSADGQSAVLDAEQQRDCSGRRSADAAGHEERGEQCETVPNF